ncbi:hypothetical protein LCGC14_1042840 [marine sediment metagenome]|uniref:Uncharacterized protein n=1 Tax=marine sediment metagenome TaxID=412755 RepID=A0A0F9Q9H4_9ZZZZ
MDDLDDFVAYLKRAAATAATQSPCTALLIDEEGSCVDLVLDTKRATTSEWIKGEGADICLYRDRDTGKVVGVPPASLPQRVESFQNNLE